MQTCRCYHCGANFIPSLEYFTACPECLEKGHEGYRGIPCRKCDGA
jgi:hypothetical protein